MRAWRSPATAAAARRQDAGPPRPPPVLRDATGRQAALVAMQVRGDACRRKTIGRESPPARSRAARAAASSRCSRHGVATSRPKPRAKPRRSCARPLPIRSPGPSGRGAPGTRASCSRSTWSCRSADELTRVVPQRQTAPAAAVPRRSGCAGARCARAFLQGGARPQLVKRTDSRSDQSVQHSHARRQGSNRIGFMRPTTARRVRNSVRRRIRVPKSERLPRPDRRGAAPEPLDRLRDRRRCPCGTHHRTGKASFGIEPIPAPAQHVEVPGLVDIAPQRLEVLPDRQVAITFWSSNGRTAVASPHRSGAATRSRGSRPRAR